MTQNIQKNELHYYLDLIRNPINSTDDDNEIYCNALHNIIRTMSLSRHGVICSENFSNLNFKGIDLRNVHFSKFGEYPCFFRGSKFYMENYLPGGLSTFSTSTFWPLETKTVSQSSEKIVLVVRGVFQHMIYIFDGEYCRQIYNFKVPSFIQNDKEFLDNIQLFSYDNNEYLGFFYTDVDSEKAFKDFRYSILIYNLNTKTEEFSTDSRKQALISLTASKIKNNIIEHIKEINELKSSSIDIDILEGIAVDNDGILYKFNTKDLKLHEYTSLLTDSDIGKVWLFNNAKMCLVETTYGKHKVFKINEKGSTFIGQIETDVKTICDIDFTNDSRYLNVWLVDELTRIDLKGNKFINTSNSNLLFRIDRKGMIHYISDTVNNDYNYMKRRNKTIHNFIQNMEKHKVVATNELVEVLQSETLRCAAINSDWTQLLIYDFKDGYNSVFKFIKLKDGCNDNEIAPQISRLEVVSVSFSPNGLYCAIACSNGTIKICDSRLQDIIYTYYCVPGVYMGGCDIKEAIAPDIIRDIINQYDLNGISPPQRSMRVLAELKNNDWFGTNSLGKSSVISNGEIFSEITLLNYFYSNKLNNLYVLFDYSEDIYEHYSNEYSVCLGKLTTGLISEISLVSEHEQKILESEYTTLNGKYPDFVKVDDEKYIVLHGMHLKETGNHYVVVCNFSELNEDIKHVVICKCIFTEDGYEIVQCESDYEIDLVFNKLNEEKMYL